MRQGTRYATHPTPCRLCGENIVFLLDRKRKIPVEEWMCDVEDLIKGKFNRNKRHVEHVCP